MQTWFIFFCFKAGRVGFLVHFAVLFKLTIVFRLVRAIALDALRALNSAGHSHIFSSSAVFALRNTRVHVGSLNDDNILLYVKASINKAFGLTPALNILDINPNDRYVRLW